MHGAVLHYSTPSDYQFPASYTSLKQGAASLRAASRAMEYTQPMTPWRVSPLAALAPLGDEQGWVPCTVAGCHGLLLLIPCFAVIPIKKIGQIFCPESVGVADFGVAHRPGMALASHCGIGDAEGFRCVFDAYCWDGDRGWHRAVLQGFALCLIALLAF